MNQEECTALGAKIANLELHYEQLISGQKARVLVDQNGERIEFNGGNQRVLFAYIASLKDQYAKGCKVGVSPISRPIRPFF